MNDRDVEMKLEWYCRLDLLQIEAETEFKEQVIRYQHLRVGEMNCDVTQQRLGQPSGEVW